MIGLIGLAMVAILLCVAVLAVRGFVKTHGAMRLLMRFAFGHHLDGKLRTNAGYLRHGTKVLHPTGHASRWAHLPHLYRAAIRWACVLVLVSLCAGVALSLRLTLIAVASAALAVLAWCVRIATRRLRRRSHVKRFVRPLHQALAPVLGLPLAARPGSWLEVPRGFGEIEGAKIRIDLPDGFLATPEAKRVVATVLTDKLGIDDGNVEFHMVGKPYATITRSSPPPDRVTFADIRAQLEAAPESAPVIGIGRKNTTVNTDFDADSPHALISAGAGGGKSTIMRGQLAQLLHNGSLGVICDIKRVSHAWARGLPNVRYCRDIEEIHNALLLVKAEVDRRNILADELANDDGDIPPEAYAQIGPRLILAMEEMNATANRLAAHWRKIKEKEDPAVSPAVEALGDILFMGRQVRVNVIAIAQMMTARALGGPEARENFATRILARYTVNAWKMLVPEVWPMPRMSRHQGRVQVVIGGQARETQVIYSTPSEAREWAVSGTLARFGTLAAGAALTASQTVPVQGPEPVSLTGPDVHLVGEIEPVGLREAVESRALTCSLDTARWARANDPEFPGHRGKRGPEFLYLPADLARWESNRVRSADDDTDEAAG